MYTFDFGCGVLDLVTAGLNFGSVATNVGRIGCSLGMVAAAVATKVGVFDLVGFLVVSKKDGHIFNIHRD